MYKKRFIEDAIISASQAFKVVLVVGPRQVGKSTTLRQLFPDHKVFTFDPYFDPYEVRTDPDQFLRNFPGPLILDEVQHVPELLSAIKRHVDESDARGQYLLTGSQNLSTLSAVSESMAGRVCIIEMPSMSIYEQAGFGIDAAWLTHYLDDPAALPKKVQGVLAQQPLVSTLWRGCLPYQWQLPDQKNINRYLDSYIKTYMDRDVRMLTQVKEMLDFGLFTKLMAALSAQEINYAQLGREIGINSRMARQWLLALQYTYLWREAAQVFGNTIKKLTRKPKGYFFDTGLLCYLHSITSPEALAGHPLVGAIFETWVSNAIHQQNSALDRRATQYHWRAVAGAEVDIVLERDNVLYPIEVRKSSSVSKHDARGMRSFREAYAHRSVAPGLIIYAGTECFALSDDTIALPWNALIQT